MRAFVGVVVCVACGRNPQAVVGDAPGVDSQAPNALKDLSSFSLTHADNPRLATDHVATINGLMVGAGVPLVTDVRALVATFTSTGMTVQVNGVDQVSGVTPNDFSTPVTYTVVAADGSTRDYVVTLAAGLSAPQRVVAGSGSYGIAVADLNRDGKPDVVVANPNENTLSILLNQTPIGGPAKFSNTTLGTGAEPFQVALGDLDGDGIADVVVADQTAPGLFIYPNTTPANATTATFGAHVYLATSVGSNPNGVVLADLNGDGKLDIVVADYGMATISVFLNTTPANASAPTFSPRFDVTANMYAVAVSASDLNGDGSPDLAVATGSGISILLNTTGVNAATPTFAPVANFSSAASEQSILVAELDGDAKPEVVTTEFPNSVSIYTDTTLASSQAATLSGPTTLSSDPLARSLAAGDLDGDGVLDLIVPSEANNSLVVFRGTSSAGSIAFEAARPFATGSSPESVRMADIDGDGKQDVIASNGADSSISILFGQ